MTSSSQLKAYYNFVLTFNVFSVRQQQNTSVELELHNICVIFINNKAKIY